MPSTALLKKPPSEAAFLLAEAVRKKVFNTTVDNAVEKQGSIVVSDSSGDGSAFCTGASAGTLVPLDADMAVPGYLIRQRACLETPTRQASH